MDSIPKTEDNPDRPRFQLFCQDAVSGMLALPGKSVKLVYGSPPYPNAKRNYGNWKTESYLETIAPFIDSIKRILRDDGFFVLNIKANRTPGTSKASSERSLVVEKLAILLKERWEMYCVDIEIWAKKCWAPTGLRCACQDVYEQMLWFSVAPKWQVDLDAIRIPYSQASLESYKNKIYRPPHNGLGYVSKEKRIEPNPLGALPRNIIYGYTSQSNENHQATQPAYLSEKYIKATTEEGDLVCNPWMGTGTTGVSACSLGRRFVGFDIFGEYIEIAERRIRDAVASRRLPGTDARDSG